jgi:hypothetical protein
MSSASTPSVSLPSLSLEAFSKDCPHPSWTRSCSQIDDDVEYMGNYRPGGFHPVVLGDVFNNRYLVVHKLGQGGFATVWLVWDQVENHYVTLKIIRADRSERCQELKILRYLGQFNIDLAENFICPLLDHFWVQGPNGSHACLVLPLAGLQVSDSIAISESYTNEERVAGARHYVHQLAHAVAFLHSIGIVHGGKYEIPRTANRYKYLIFFQISPDPTSSRKFAPFPPTLSTSFMIVLAILSGF